MPINKSDIQKLIKIQKADTFWNHFLYILKKDSKSTGEVHKNTIKVWQQRKWNGAFYPVYTFEFNSQNQLTKISDRLNIFGKVFNLTFLSIFLFLFILSSFNDFD